GEAYGGHPQNTLQIAHIISILIMTGLSEIVMTGDQCHQDIQFAA
ncbi:MAG: hypothetical protein H6Q24_1036, partial [Bacteroidetes bacterium]|nr:hypothetical protein [Bacteroidota bacterium]